MADQGSYTVGGPYGGDGTFQIDFPGALAWEEEERIDQLAELLEGRPEIERAIHEDREFILVEAPGIALATLEALVAEAWDEAAIGGRYRQFNDAGELVDAERPSR